MKQTLRNCLLLVAVLFAAQTAWAQSRQVQGTVSDPSGQKLAGITVMVVGTSTGAATDKDGNYTVTVPNVTNAALRFSFIGYKTQEIQVNGRAQIDVALAEDMTVIDEVVAIGYATVKRADLVGSVSSVGSATLNVAPVASVVEAMTGRMAGVTVTTTEGNPDADVKIRVRGGGSITQSNQPLYIVDGFPLESISDIPASDIESIDVLKDAFSTAIYGSRGANGVIIVRTKSGGKDGKISVSYNMFAGFKTMATEMDVLDPYEYVQWQYELQSIRSISNSNSIASKYVPYFGNYQDIDLYKGVKGNNWQQQVFGQTGSTFNQNLSIRGGSDTFSWTAGYAYVKDGAIMVGSDFKRTNLNFKANYKPRKSIAFDFSMRYSDTDVKGSGSSSFNDKGSTNVGGRLKQALLYSPIPLKGVTAGSDELEDYENVVEPLTAVRDSDSKRERKNWNINGAFTWEIVKGLKFKTEAGMDDYRQVDNKFYGPTNYASLNNAYSDANVNYKGLPLTTYSDATALKYRNTNTLSYDLSQFFSKRHKLDVLLGQEYMAAESNRLTHEVQGFPSFFDSDMAWNYTSSGAYRYETGNFFYPDDKLFSLFGRANYTFDNRFIFSVTMRADGSSKFADGNRWGYFPSAAASWRLSDEKWLKSVDWLSNLKLRYSYGTAGNNNIPSGLLYREFTDKSTAWLSNSSVYGTVGDVMPNKDLVWETTYSQNIGVDFGVFNNRYNLTIEVYQNNVKDLLIEVPVTGSGYKTQFQNAGQTRNQGIELTLNAALIKNENYGLDFSFNIGFNNPKVVKLSNPYKPESEWASSEIGQDFRIVKGGQVGEMYGYVTDGRYEVDDFLDYAASGNKWVLKNGVANNSSIIDANYLRPGALKLKNIDGSDDNMVTINDRKVIGNANPIHTGGFSFAGYAYGFDLTANFNWVYGNDIYNANRIETTSSRKYDYRNLNSEMALGKRWTNIDWTTGALVNDPATLAAMNTNTTMWSPAMKNAVFHSWAVEDGSFLRMSTLSIGYTIPESLVKKAKLKNVRVYATGSNLFCWTNYSGLDPEVDTRRKTPLTPGVDYSGYPKARQWVFGLNLNF